MVVVMMAALVAGCGVDTEGAGDEFVIVGRVEKVGERSVTVTGVVVESAAGHASGWFGNDKHQIHNNYKTCEGDLVTVGGVVTPRGDAALDVLDAGQRVRIVGSIRESAGSCDSEYLDDQYERRPVFTIVETGTN